jgi:hypothetical protein
LVWTHKHFSIERLGYHYSILLTLRTRIYCKLRDFEFYRLIILRPESIVSFWARIRSEKNPNLLSPIKLWESKRDWFCVKEFGSVWKNLVLRERIWFCDME